MEAHADSARRLLVGHEDIFHAVGKLSVGGFAIGGDITRILGPQVGGWGALDFFF